MLSWQSWTVALVFCYVLLDLSAAFDTVDHWLLLERMTGSFGITGISLNILFGRSTQVVNINGPSSAKKTMPCGVPQGSLLGPLLFSLYMPGTVDERYVNTISSRGRQPQLYLSFDLQNAYSIVTQWWSLNSPSKVLGSGWPAISWEWTRVNLNLPLSNHGGRKRLNCKS